MEIAAETMTKPFEPFVFYNPDAPEGAFEVFLSNKKFYGKWLNQYITVYYADNFQSGEALDIPDECREVVGICISHVKYLIEKELKDGCKNG